MTTVARRAFFFACLTLLITSTSGAATLVVDDDGAQCIGAPYTTITAALAAAAPTGDTIQVCDGTYDEPTRLVTKEVIIDGVNRDATLINVSVTGRFGFHVRASNVTISDMTIQEVGGAGVTDANGIRYEQVLLGPALNNNVVFNVNFFNFEGGAARGIEVHDATMNDLSIDSSFFTNNTTGIRLSSNSHVDGLLLNKPTFSAPANLNDFSRVGLYQANDGGTSTLRDLQLTTGSFTNMSLAGIFVEELQDSSINNSVFTGNYTGIIFNKVFLNSGVDVRNVDISFNTFTNNTGRAVFLASTMVGLGPGVVIDNNDINVNVANLLGPTNRGAITTNFPSTLTHSPLTISSNDFIFSGAFTTATTTWGVNLIGDGPVVITGNLFDGNDVTSTGTPPFAGIYITSNHATFGLRQDPVTITCNDILDFVHGITVYDSVGATGGGLPPGTSVEVHLNDIVGNSAFGIFNGTVAGSSATIDAESNWWGSASGPGGAGPGTGDAISENVDAIPFSTVAQTCLVLVGADLDVEKTLLTTGPITQGQTITFRLDVTNNGPEDASGVVVTDVLPPGLQFVDSSCATEAGGTVTWTVGDLEVAATTSCEFRAVTTGTGSTTNTATVTGTPADPGGPDSDGVTFDIGAAVGDIPLAGTEGLLIMAVLLALAGSFIVTRIR